ncbi:hypothetical protein H6P81_021315 [Aristolochia fimbriata]|uniref:Uncharacterized protein n=1 Tax=Aristolochia fimbriata TaxID=158543 RepID=A0AAV7DQ86_ARIFI|nr:hypothetical protein H6P81_021315 [Aristolochia fimbriata]
MAFSSSQQAGKGPSGSASDPFAQLEVFDLSRSSGDRSVPLSPILIQFVCASMALFVGFAMHGSGHRRGGSAAASRGGARWTYAPKWCFRSIMSRCVSPPLPFITRTSRGLVGSLAFPCPFETRRRTRVVGGYAAGAIGVALFSSRLSLTPVCSNAGRRKCSWTHVNAAVPMDLVDSQTKSDRLTFARPSMPPPRAEAHSRSGAALRRRVSREDATWLILPVVICLSQRLSHACVDSPLLPGDAPLALTGRVAAPCCYFEEIRVLKASLRLDTLAWDNITGFRSYCVGLRIGVMINRGRPGHSYFIVEVKFLDL